MGISESIEKLESSQNTKSRALYLNHPNQFAKISHEWLFNINIK